MKRKPRRRNCTISSITTSEVRWRGRWPSVRQTEQKEQCLGQPRTVCTDDHMCAPELKRFLGIKRGVDSTENHISTPLSCHLSNFIATQSVCGMNTDPDGVPLLNSARIHLE